MRALTLLLTSVLLVCPITAVDAQDSRAALESVAKALGATGLTSIEIQGGGTTFQVGQAYAAGTAWPFVTAVNERNATLVPLTSRIVERLASLGERAVPACLRPARSSALRVVSIPYWPASSEWFEAVLQASQPIARTERARAGGVRKLG